MNTCFVIEDRSKCHFVLTEILRFRSTIDWLRFPFNDKYYGSILYTPVHGSSRLSNHFWKFRSNFWTSATVPLYRRCQVNFCAFWSWRKAVSFYIYEKHEEPWFTKTAEKWFHLTIIQLEHCCDCLWVYSPSLSSRPSVT